MCLAIWKPGGQKIDKEKLEAGYTANSHGAGFAYAHKKELFINKGYFTFDAFYKDFKLVESLPCLIHFRIRTSGPTDKNNCHPWEVTPNLALVHNGILSLKDADGLSDTGVFAQHVLRPIIQAGPDLWKNKGVQWMIDEAIGVGNKMVLMDNHGDHCIINEKQGDWDSGSWFSNTCYRWGRSKSSHRGGFQVDDGYPRDYGSAHSTSRNYGSNMKPRWVESSIPHVYLLSKEAADVWVKKDRAAEAAEAAARASAPTAVKVIDRTTGTDAMLEAEIERLKKDGWEEWHPNIAATTAH